MLHSHQLETAMRVLLVEDDILLGEAIRDGLVQYAYTVDWMTDGAQADAALQSESFDVVVLDIGLPKRSGLEVLAALRDRGQLTPVIILTARGALDDRVQGLTQGADDYLIKPVDLAELHARIIALHRRSAARAETAIVVGKVSLDPSAHTVSIDDDVIATARREFALLHKLLDQVGKVVTRDKLAQALYGWNDEVDSNAIEVHIHNLRKKFGHVLKIRTIRGVGYMIEKAE